MDVTGRTLNVMMSLFKQPVASKFSSNKPLTGFRTFEDVTKDLWLPCSSRKEYEGDPVTGMAASYGSGSSCLCLYCFYRYGGVGSLNVFNSSICTGWDYAQTIRERQVPFSPFDPSRTFQFELCHDEDKEIVSLLQYLGKTL